MKGLDENPAVPLRSAKCFCSHYMRLMRTSLTDPPWFGQLKLAGLILRLFLQCWINTSFLIAYCVLMNWLVIFWF